jgi:hypothetical protein
LDGGDGLAAQSWSHAIRRRSKPAGKIKTVVEEMDELPLEELEALALESVRREQGCDHVEAVNIKPLNVQGTAPNWDVVEFIPPLRMPAMRSTGCVRCTR